MILKGKSILKVVKHAKMYIHVGGGLGDTIRLYLRDDRIWGYLESLKTNYPPIVIRLMSTSHNPQTIEFFRHHPYINEMHEFGWNLHGDIETINRHKTGYIDIHSGIRPYQPKLVWKQPTYYLSNKDQEEANSILSDNRGLIVMHPFALRQAMPIEEFIYMTDRLIDEFGYTVAFLGGNNNRIHNLNAEGTYRLGYDMKEECDYERPYLYNLLNKSTSIRTCYKLIECCVGFIGHGSCFNIAAWHHSKKSVLFSRSYERSLLTTNIQYAWPIMQNLPWCKNYYDDEWSSTRHVANETVEFFRR